MGDGKIISKIIKFEIKRNIEPSLFAPA